jgi:hypothetical protein
MAAFHSMVHRAINIPMDIENFNEEINTIKNLAKLNGFSIDIINNIIKNKQRKLDIKIATKLKLQNQIENKWASIKFLGPISFKISKILNELGIKVGFKTKNTIFNTIKKIDKPINKLGKSGVYKLTCQTCEGSYVGQSGRKIIERIKEHEAAWRNQKKGHSSFADHLIEYDHQFNPDCIDLIHECNKGYKLNLLETLEINRNKESRKPFFNDILELNRSALLQPLEY